MKYTFSWYKKKDPWIFLLPTLLGLFVFRLGPIIGSFLLSFTDWDIIKKPRFIGLENYIELFNNPSFIEVLSNTLLFAFIYVIGVTVIGLFLAVLLNRNFKGISFFRSAFYTPVVTSAVAVGIIWSWILSPNYGVLNLMLLKLGINPPYWLGDTSIALFTVASVQVWKMAGYYMIVFLAGLQGIPRSLLEAAHIDGASPRRSFFTITLPLLSPTTFFVVSIAIIDSFKNFELIYAMTKGGPQNATNTLVYDVFLNAFVYYRMGYASTVAYVLLALVAGFSILNFTLKKHWVNYQY
jgi:multiple sugar transport system permease protein